MDNATEEQSKKVKNDPENEEAPASEPENIDELMEKETAAGEPLENVPELENEQLNENSKSNKNGSNNERQNEVCETKEEYSVEGDLVSTHTVSRPGDTTAHCSYVELSGNLIIKYLL